MTIPIALESLFRIVLPFEAQELRKPRIARFHLGARGMPMVGQIVAAAPANGHIDQPTESGRGVLFALRGVRDVQVENHAGVWLLSPLEKGFPVAFDKTNRAIDYIHTILPEILRRF